MSISIKHNTSTFIKMASQDASEWKVPYLKKGDEVITPIHVSRIETKLPQPHQWIPLRGKIVNTALQGKTHQFEIEISGNTGFQNAPFRIWSAASQIKKITVPQDSRNGEGIIERIISCRLHHHNRGEIRCEMVCEAKKDYLIKWKDEEGPKSTSWEPGSVLNPAAIAVFEGKDNYKVLFLIEMKTFFCDMTKNVDPSDREALKAAITLGTIERKQHDCRRFPNLCKGFLKVPCNEIWDFIIFTGPDNSDPPGRKRFVIPGSLAPMENFFLKELLKTLPQDSTCFGYGGHADVLYSSSVIQLPVDDILEKCFICENDLIAIESQVVCLSCKRPVHVVCAKRLLSQPRERICLECDSSRCGICFSISFTGGVAFCPDCRRQYCKEKCMTEFRPSETSEQILTRCATCALLRQNVFPSEDRELIQALREEILAEDAVIGA